MSYDFYLDGQHLASYTSNAGPVFVAANHGKDLKTIMNGKSGRRTVSVLANLASYMVAHKDKLEPLTPIKGWSDYEGALGLIYHLIEVSKTNSNSIWIVRKSGKKNRQSSSA